KANEVLIKYGGKAFGPQGDLVVPQPVSKNQGILTEVQTDMDPARDRMDRERAKQGLLPATDKEFKPYYQADLEKRVHLSADRKHPAGDPGGHIPEPGRAGPTNPVMVGLLVLAAVLLDNESGRHAPRDEPGPVPGTSVATAEVQPGLVTRSVTATFGSAASE